MAVMEKRNVSITLGILGGFAVAAYIANIFTDRNYMFLSRGDGTPYDIFFNLLNGNPVLYPICVVGMLVVYILLYYRIYHAILNKKAKKAATAAA